MLILSPPPQLLDKSWLSIKDFHFFCYVYIVISCCLEPCEPSVSFTDVSIEDFNQLQRLIAEYQASRVQMSKNNSDSLKEGPSVKFANVLSAMEQYFANALKSTAISLR
jgi:hypothetical protein